MCPVPTCVLAVCTRRHGSISNATKACGCILCAFVLVCESRDFKQTDVSFVRITCVRRTRRLLYCEFRRGAARYCCCRYSLNPPLALPPPPPPLLLSLLPAPVFCSSSRFAGLSHAKRSSEMMASPCNINWEILPGDAWSTGPIDTHQERRLSIATMARLYR